MIEVLTGIAQAVSKTGQEVQGLASLEGNWASFDTETYNYDSALHNALTHTVRGGAMGPTGSVLLLLMIGLIAPDNGAGSTIINPITFALGGTTLFSFALTGLGANANRRASWPFLLSISNRADQALQDATVFFVDPGAGVVPGIGASAANVFKGYNEVAVDTSVDNILTVDITAAGTDVDRLMRRQWGKMLVTYGE